MNDNEHIVALKLFNGLNNTSDPKDMTAWQCADLFWYIKTFNPDTPVSNEIVTRIATESRKAKFYYHEWLTPDQVQQLLASGRRGRNEI